MASRAFLPISKHVTGFQSQLAMVWLPCCREQHFKSHLHTLGPAYVLATQLASALIGKYYFVLGLEKVCRFIRSVVILRLKIRGRLKLLFDPM